jgi:hypothetical protein
MNSELAGVADERRKLIIENGKISDSLIGGCDFLSSLTMMMGQDRLRYTLFAVPSIPCVALDYGTVPSFHHNVLLRVEGADPYPGKNIPHQFAIYSNSGIANDDNCSS